jgi:hypothetical protein
MVAGFIAAYVIVFVWFMVFNVTFSNIVVGQFYW